MGPRGFFGAFLGRLWRVLGVVPSGDAGQFWASCEIFCVVSVNSVAISAENPGDFGHFRAMPAPRFTNFGANPTKFGSIPTQFCHFCKSALAQLLEDHGEGSEVRPSLSQNDTRNFHGRRQQRYRTHAAFHKEQPRTSGAHINTMTERACTHTKNRFPTTQHEPNETTSTVKQAPGRLNNADASEFAYTKVTTNNSSVCSFTDSWSCSTTLLPWHATHS